MRTTNFRFALAITGIICLFAACKQDIKNVDSSTTTAPTAAPVTTTGSKPEMYLYMVTVDNLLLRDQPSQKGSKVVSKFPEGDFVEGKGEVSSTKEEATLRGAYYNEPYYKVVSTTPKQTSGWAYGGALRCVYAGPRANTPDLGKLSQYAMFLKTLSPKKLESGKKVTDYITQNLSDASGALADAVFLMTDNFMRRMDMEGEFYTLTESVKWADADYQAVYENKYDMSKNPVTQKLAANGFRLQTAEGSIFPEKDMAKLGAMFGSKVTPGMKRYIEMSVEDQKEQMYDDGGIIMDLKDVAARAVQWEKFNQENPYFALADQTQYSEVSVRNAIVCGADNTPTFDFEKGTITDEVKKVWTDILAQYPGTKLAADVKTLVDVCNANGWKHDKQVEEIQMKFAQREQ